MKRGTLIGMAAAGAAAIAYGLKRLQSHKHINTSPWGNGTKLKKMEAGEIPTIEPVEVASEDSFPASDAPAWTGTTGSRA